MTVRRVRIGDVLELQRRPIEIDPLAEYVAIGVRSFGKGIFHYPPTTGNELSKLRFFEMAPDELVLSNIKAWEGAIAVSSDAEQDVIGSNRFLSYRPVGDDVDMSFLRYFLLSEVGLPLIQRASPGSADRNRTLAIDRFEALEIPLPPIDEQQRTVRTIQDLRRFVEPIKERAARGRLLGSSLTNAMAGGSRAHAVDLRHQDWEQVALGAVISAATDPVKVEPVTEYPNVGVFSFARGLFEKPPIDGSNTSAGTLYRIRSGQFIYSRLFAFEGAYASVPDRFDGYYVSNEFPAFDVDPERADVGFLTAYFSAPDVWERVAMGSKGLGVRRQRVQQEQLLNHILWLPPLEEQRRIGRVAGRLAEIGRLRGRASVLADAIEPAALNRAFAGLV